MEKRKIEAVFSLILVFSSVMALVVSTATAMTNYVGVSFETIYMYGTLEDAVSNVEFTAPEKRAHSGIHNSEDGTGQIVDDPTLTFTTTLPVLWFDERDLVSTEPYTWRLRDLWECEGDGHHVGIAESVVFKPGFDADRVVSPTDFLPPGGTQTVTVNVTPKEEMDEIDMGISAEDDLVVPKIISYGITPPGVGKVDISENWLRWSIWDPTVDTKYTLVATIDVVLREKVESVQYKPEVGVEARHIVDFGDVTGGGVSTETEVGTWEWSANTTVVGEYLWHWEEWKVKSVVFTTNDVGVDFETIYMYGTLEDAVSNDDFTVLEKRAHSGIHNRPDETRLPVDDPILMFTTTHPVSWVDTRDLVSTEPYTWRFHDFKECEGDGRGVDIAEAITFTPGFNVSRSVNLTTFAYPGGTQTLTLEATVFDDMDELNFQVWCEEVDNLIAARIISPTTDEGIWLSEDGRYLSISVGQPNVGATYRYTITIEVELLVADLESQAKFMPRVGVQAVNFTASGYVIGGGVSRTTEVGTWAWSADTTVVGPYLWHWNERLTKKVHLEGYAICYRKLPPVPSQAEIDEAIERGLAWLAGQQNPDGSWNYTRPGRPTESYPSVSVTGMAVLAFEQQGHLPTGDPELDPYVDVVRKGLDYILANARVEKISGPDYLCPSGDPDKNGNGIGIYFSTGNDLYDTGIAIMAIVGSLAPGRVATTGPIDVVGRTYKEIVEDAVEFCAWAQNDYPTGRGGWRYNANFMETWWYDNFDRYHICSDASPTWSIDFGTWHVEEEWEEEREEWNRVYSVGDTTPLVEAIAFTGEESWGDEARVRVKIVEMTSSSHVGFLFRFVNSSNFYEFGIVGNELRLIKRQGGTETVLKSTDFTPEPGKWYWLHVSAYEGHITARLEYEGKEEKFEFDDPSPIPSGKIGLRADSTQAHFDEVWVGDIITKSSESDNSVTQWPPLGLYMAEDMWGIVAPDFVKPELLEWLDYTKSTDGGFGYDKPGGSNVLRAGSGLSSLAYCGVSSTDPRVLVAIDYLERNWQRGLEPGKPPFTQEDNFGNLEAMYGVMKACVMLGIEFVGEHNWYEEYAAWLNSIQVVIDTTTGYWPAGVWGNEELETAWAILILCRKVVPTIYKMAELVSTADGDLWVEVGEKAVWSVTVRVHNLLGYDMSDVVVTDRFGAEIKIDGYVASKGTVKLTYLTKGKQGPILTWNIGYLAKGEVATLVLTVSTGVNPAGHQQYTSWGTYQLNSGVTLKFKDEEGAQVSEETPPITVNVWITVVELKVPKGFEEYALAIKEQLESQGIGCVLIFVEGKP